MQSYQPGADPRQSSPYGADFGDFGYGGFGADAPGAPPAPMAAAPHPPPPVGHPHAALPPTRTRTSWRECGTSTTPGSTTST